MLANFSKKLTLKKNESKGKQMSIIFIMPTSKNLFNLLTRQCPGNFPYQIFNIV